MAEGLSYYSLLSNFASNKKFHFNQISLLHFQNQCVMMRIQGYTMSEGKDKYSNVNKEENLEEEIL